jgi:hypothetical protein
LREILFHHAIFWSSGKLLGPNDCNDWLVCNAQYSNLMSRPTLSNYILPI